MQALCDIAIEEGAGDLFDFLHTYMKPVTPRFRDALVDYLIELRDTKHPRWDNEVHVQDACVLILSCKDGPETRLSSQHRREILGILSQHVPDSKFALIAVTALCLNLGEEVDDLRRQMRSREKTTQKIPCGFRRRLRDEEIHRARL